MTDPTSDPAGQTPPQSQLPATVAPGFIKGLINEVRLAWRLFRDPRVPLGLKLIPPTALIYTLSPIDLLPDIVLGLGQLDDLAVLVLGVRMFVEMCPPEIVHEHRQALWGPAGMPGAPGAGSVIDGAWKTVDPDNPNQP